MLQSKALQYKSSLKQTAFVLIDPIADQSIGCSLKIHRVEISVAGGKQEFVKVLLHRAASDNFDCVKTDILRLQIYLVMTNISKIAISRNYSHYGITREVRDLTQSLI